MYQRVNNAAMLMNACAQLGVWLVLGAQIAGLAGANPVMALPVVAIAVVIVLATLAIGLPLFFRANRRMLTELATLSGSYAASGAEGEFAPARVVRSRAAARFAGFLAGHRTPVEPTARIVVLDALSAAGPRRVLALVPASWHPYVQNRAFAAVRLIGPHTDAAVLDGRIDAAALGQIAADPRWNGRIPGDPVGRQLAVIGGAALVGLAIGIGVPLLLSALLG